MDFSTTITFEWGKMPREFRLRPCGVRSPWRYLDDACAVELVPVCDENAIPSKEPPKRCDRFEIWPVQWGYPDSLVSDHPDEVDQMRRDHVAGKHDLVDGNYTWQYWLKNYGKAELWHSFRTPEMERSWLNWRTGHGSTLSVFAGLAGRIKREDLQTIRFRADYFRGDVCETVFLSDCRMTPLTDDERRNSPTAIHRKEKLLDKGIAFESIKAENRRAEAQAQRELAQQPVTRQQVRDAFLKHGVKTDRGIGKIVSRCGFKQWPVTAGELNALMRKYVRRKKTFSEAVGKRNRDRANKKRGGPHDAGR